MTFDDIVNESIIEYVETDARKRCWCGGATAKATTGDLALICTESVYHNPLDEGRPTNVKRLYIAGPMTGYPQNNYPLFNGAAASLRARGFDVVNPAEFGNHNGTTSSYVDLLRNDLRALLDCDGVAALDMWWESVGARNEIQVAGTLKMPVRSVYEWEMRS